MTTELTCALALLALVAACRGSSASPARPLLSDLEGAPLEIARSCELTSVRCSRCHPIERLLRARARSPTHWQRYVYRMRLMPASGISVEDARRILRCLVYRSFGKAGLEDLDHGRRTP